jgi:hypothetical protein
MYLDSGTTTLNGKTYQRHLLRESYREDGKVKNRTIASLSHCTFADCTVPGGLDELGAIHSTIVTLKEASCQKIPEPSRVAKALLDAMQVRLPEVIEARHVVVVTRKKISESRKK